MNKFSLAKKIAYTSLFSALCLVCTLFISIPFPVGHGYFNLGDTARNHLTEFDSNNTQLLTVEETKTVISSLEYIKAELEGAKN